jgi:hypothetical protein
MNCNRWITNKLVNVLVLILVRSIFDSGLCERNRSDRTSYAELLTLICKKRFSSEGSIMRKRVIRIERRRDAAARFR